MFTNFLLLVFTAALLYVAFTLHTLKTQSKETNLIVYVHDYFTGEEGTAGAITVAGRSRGKSNNLQYSGSSMAVVHDLVTEGPSNESKKIGRAQELYWSSGMNEKVVYMVFSVIFTDGSEFKGSSLEIVGYDSFNSKKREFGVASGTGFFQFVKGYAIMETQFIALPNPRAVIKLNLTVKHY